MMQQKWLCILQIFSKCTHQKKANQQNDCYLTSTYYLKTNGKVANIRKKSVSIIIITIIVWYKFSIAVELFDPTESEPWTINTKFVQVIYDYSKTCDATYISPNYLAMCL